MAYIINDSRGQVVAIIPDGTVDTTSTSLQLVGRSVTEYGVAENENYVWLMENFAAPVAPVTPLQGQLWFDTSSDTMYVRGMTNTWTGIADFDYVQAQKVSPIFTGIPQSPTAVSPLTNTDQIATTKFVQNNKVSPAFTGVPTAPTAPRGTNTTQIATTEFVTSSVLLQGTPEAPTAANGTTSNQIATTEFVQNIRTNTVLLGSPTAPTAPAGTNNTQIATTQFVASSVQLFGVPTAPTAPPGTNNTQIATTQFVANSVQLFGVPTAPTAPNGTANTQIATTAFVSINPTFTGNVIAPTVDPATSNLAVATTAFVQAQKANIVLTGIPLAPLANGTVLDQIATVQFVQNRIAAIDLTPYATKASPIFTGIPQAPTASAATNTDQLATTKFIKDVVASQYGLWQGSAKFVSTGDPTPSDGANGDFWFKYQP